MDSQPRIAPKYAFRFDPIEIKARYGSFDRAFAAGDYLTAVQLAAPESEDRACALVLAGLTDRGLEILQDRPRLSGRGKLCHAFALWSLGRAGEARSILRIVGEPDWTAKAQRFLGLLGRDKVTVFVPGAILPVFNDAALDAMPPVVRCGSFELKYVASQMPNSAHLYDPRTSFGEFVAALGPDQRPDFIFSLSPQWIVPKGFSSLNVPKILWGHDVDTFLYRNRENFRLYDAIICSNSQEHFELSKSTGAFCAANLIVHPLAQPPSREAIAGEKTIDVLFTGSVFNAAQAERSRFIYALAELGEERVIRIFDGYLPKEQYLAALSQARFVPVINRYAGAPSPRWREALAAGAGVLFPQGTLYDEVATGCLPYRAAAVAADIREHLAKSGPRPLDLERSGQAAQVLADESREEAFEKLLKYAAFIACVWQEQGAPAKGAERRAVWLTPQIDCSIFGRDNVKGQIAAIAGSIGTDDLRDEIDCANAAHLYAQLAILFPLDPKFPHWCECAERHFVDGLTRFPQSLLLRFNRALWRHLTAFHSDAKAEAEFRALLDEFPRLSFDPKDANLGFGNCSDPALDNFPYAEYADAVTRLLVATGGGSGEEVPEALVSEPRQIILSGCHGYLGAINRRRRNLAEALAHLDEAVALYPANLAAAQLRLNIILENCVTPKTLITADATKLADAVVDLANLYPGILLAYTPAAVPILVANDREDAAGEILRAWYRLANVVEAEGQERRSYRWLERAGILMHYRDCFPATLKRKLTAAAGASTARLSQVERVLFASIDRASRPPAPDEIRQLVHDVLAEEDYITERQFRLHLRQAFLLWLGLSWSERWKYLSRAVRWVVRQDLRTTASQIVRWRQRSAWQRADESG